MVDKVFKPIVNAILPINLNVGETVLNKVLPCAGSAAKGLTGGILNK